MSYSRSAAVAAAAISAFTLAALSAQAPPAGIRDPAWSPDGKRLAVSRHERILTMTPDGRDPKAVVSPTGTWVSERDPAYSSDGKSIAFSADTAGQFDLWIAPASGGAARRVTSMDGDERWPSWVPDGRLVFSHRPPRGVWQLYIIVFDPDVPNPVPAKITPDDASEWQGRVAPDGKRVAFISDRDLEPADDGDLWTRDLLSIFSSATPGPATRITRTVGLESYPAWAPDSARIAYLATRQGQGTAIWVSPIATMVPASGGGPAPVPVAGPGRGGGGGAGGAGAATIAALASRRAGTPAWSPDSQTLAIATIPTGTAAYNGNPNRNDDDPPVALGDADHYTLWRVGAPRPIDDGAKAVAMPAPESGRLASAFDRVWQTLKSLYYASGPSAPAWDALRAKHRPAAEGAASARDVEAAVDALVAEQPLIKPSLETTGAVVASGHPLASAAGRSVLEKGGNIVDAIVATAFALGVVEPDASGVGGDGQAILFLKGMSEPIVIEYKDMTPGHATNDNPRLFRDGTRIAGDGPSVANIPGVVAGLDLLYTKYGSKKVSWADILAPAIALAEEGYVLDEALPTTIAEGRSSFAKYPEAAKIYLPGGKVPKAGDRFVNKDYAEMLKVLAKEGGQSFYRGTIARRIAADMEANGGIITLEDLAQYRAMERAPLSGHYRGHLVYSVPPPVSNGLGMIETLQILDNYTPKPGATAFTDPDYFHYAIEAWRVRDGGSQIADPERWPINLGNHLQPGHALDRFKLIDPRKVYVAPQGGRRGGGPAPAVSAGASSGLEAIDLLAPSAVDGPEEGRRVQSGTTSFAAADAEGNMIAVTQTLSTWGGNYYVSKGLGFLYNDHFRGGRGGTGYGAMLPLMRSSSTSVPTLVFAPSQVDPGRYGIPGFSPRLAVGCAGNAWIPASVYSIILNVVDGGMTAQRAIEAPRYLIGGGPGGGSRVQIEDRIPRSVLADLEARGHSFQKVGRKGEVKYGYAALAVVNAAKGTVEGGAEPRRSHATAGSGQVVK